MADDIPPLGAVTPNVPPTSSPLPAGAMSAEPMNLPPISLDHAAAKACAGARQVKSRPNDAEVAKDAFREMLETIVFVVVLVLMLKTFLAEAFVIPTGSMATTLLGYHHKETCEQCGYPNLINASREAEAPDPRDMAVPGYRCINCRFYNNRPQAMPREVPK